MAEHLLIPSKSISFTCKLTKHLDDKRCKNITVTIYLILCSTWITKCR